MKPESYVAAVVSFLSFVTIGIGAPSHEEEIPGTRAYFETHIEGRYGYTNGLMFTLQQPSSYIEGTVIQIIDKDKILISTSVTKEESRSWTEIFKLARVTEMFGACKFSPKILLVEDTGKITEGHAISVWGKYAEKFNCLTSEGRTNVLEAYRTPIPDAVTFEQYTTLFKTGVHTPDRFPKIVACEPLRADVQRPSRPWGRPTYEETQRIMAELNRKTIDELKAYLTKLETEDAAQRAGETLLTQAYGDAQRNKAAAETELQNATGAEKDKALLNYQKAKASVEETLGSANGIRGNQSKRRAFIEMTRSVLANRISSQTPTAEKAIATPK